MSNPKKQTDKTPIKELLKRQDAFLSTSEKFYEFFLRNVRVFIAVAAVLVLLLIAGVVYTNRQAANREAAAAAFDRAWEMMADRGQVPAAIEAMEKVRADHSGSKPARLAGYTLIRLYVTENKNAEAVAVVEELLKTITPDEQPLKSFLLFDLGGLYEEQKQFEKAAASYEAALNLMSGENRIDVMMSLARVQASAGKTDEAVKLYENVIKEFPYNPKILLALNKITELTGKVRLAPPLAPQAPPVIDDEPAAPQGSGAAAGETAEKQNQGGSAASKSEVPDQTPAGEAGGTEAQNSAGETGEPAEGQDDASSGKTESGQPAAQ